ncbi:hypothetical protein [Sulfitobacter guttiformis]|uniref:Uncharacterized protein n=1 Tax=Sulfitobacter guttiformis TaxID=74349 RepID=A0A420DJJ8_9RHOB|nr:hypothetical protein [Sulfitobacter guttiformis]KIN71764.1 hypothetical protein Z949_927 [Sulfitobacter guttiformis KCTC 32187]RKE94416.1 hypothetical protein C8N30_3543 [Sulfitobacter guttiformis]
MDWTFLTAGLAFSTLLAAIFFAYISKRKVDERLHDKRAPKSTLAKDQDSHAKPADV